MGKIKFSKRDQLFLLGDYINKGPRNREVLDYIMKLQKQGFYIYTLRGNHEEMLLESQQRGKQDLLNFTFEQNSRDLLNNREELSGRYVKFIKRLPYYFLLEDFVLVHAGFNFSARNPLKDYRAMLYIRDFPVDLSFLKERRLIHGHNPKPLSLIEAFINEKSPVIPLDNGCVYWGKRADHGHLLAFNLNSQDLVKKENIDLLRYSSS